MTIQNDRWITEMAKTHGMIEPFEDRQVRQGVISYGVSSYGYDMRVAREFRIFTNVLSSVIDPKAFDPKSFVEFEGDVCIVPPNSFALARSVEYFRIPRDVVTLCVGKSTYARCFRGDTRVALVDGTAPTLEEMARRSDEGELFWGYGIGPRGRLLVSLLDAPRFIGRDALVEVGLDDGRTVHCTPDHEFLRRDGSLVAADSLRAGDALMPLYRQTVRGQESVYQPMDGQLTPTHRLADDWNVENGLYRDVPGTYRHHRDHDLRNNRPSNLGRTAAGEHVRRRDPGTDDEEAYAAARERLRTMRRDPWTADRKAPLGSALRTSGGRPGAWEARGEETPSARVAVAHDRGTPLYRNHKVAYVRPLPGDHDVYCLTAPECGNFALESGVFVKNCGIITNVTPFEPEWEGFVTLEISNTTPLPARIYANEGIAQVLFFRGSEPPQVSYRDKKGKYQGQVGVTLPKL